MNLKDRVGHALRRYFVTGLATLFPVAVTTYLLVVIFKFSDGFLGKRLGLQIPGLGLLITIAFIFATGVFSVHFFGRVVFRTLEDLLVRLPVVSKILPAVKQLAGFLFGDGESKKQIRRVVLVQYPREGVYTMAFVTNEMTTQVTGKTQTLLTLLLPNPPSPFTGPIVFAPEEDVIPLDLSVEEAAKLIVSGGVVGAPFRAAALGK